MRAVIIVLVLSFAVSTVLGELSFTVLGDWGKKIAYTDAIATRSVQEKSQFTVAIGDNFYKNSQSPVHGVESVNDPKWQYIFEDQFHQPFFQKRWYVIAGNHDYDGNEIAQVEYTKKSKRWYFPSLYYKFTKKAAKGVTVDFFMIDSHVLTLEDKELVSYGRKKDMAQFQWLKKQLKNSKATWKLVFGHHHIFTASMTNKWMRQNVVPLFEKYKVAAYISGHLHNFQHVRTPKVHYITAGNTAIQNIAQLKKPHKQVTVKYRHPTEEQFPSCGAYGCMGFVIANVKDKKAMTVKYYNSANKLMYTIHITNPNK